MSRRSSRAARRLRERSGSRRGDDRVETAKRRLDAAARATDASTRRAVVSGLVAGKAVPAALAVGAVAIALLAVPKLRRTMPFGVGRLAGEVLARVARR